MGMYYCPNCNADLDDQFGFDPSEGKWTCTECGQFLIDCDIEDGDIYPDVAWICDNCDALLNRQSGFSDIYGTWTCTECGYTNNISDEEIIEDEHICPNCEANLKKQYGYSIYCYDWKCAECDTELHRDYIDSEFDIVEDTEEESQDHNDNEKNCDDKNINENIHACPNCGANLKTQWGYSIYCYDWTCTECDTELHRDYSDSEFDIVEDTEEDDEDYDDNEYYYDDPQNGYENDTPHSSSTTYNNSSNYKNKKTYRSEYVNTSNMNYNSTSPQLLSKSEVRKKRMKAFFFKRNFIPVEYSSYSLKGKSFEEVYAILYNCGFKYIKCVYLKDIYVNSPFRENEVDKVEINKQSQFDANSEFPYNSKVVVTSHKKKEIAIPYSASSLRKLKYNCVCSGLSTLGFTRIYASPIKDLITGWITKNGSVERVVINNNSSFKKHTLFKYDATIIVYYHTFM